MGFKSVSLPLYFGGTTGKLNKRTGVNVQKPAQATDAAALSLASSSICSLEECSNVLARPSVRLVLDPRLLSSPADVMAASSSCLSTAVLPRNEEFIPPIFK